MMDRQKLLEALPAIERYAVTVLAAVCTLAVRLVLDPFLGDRAPYLFFVLMVVVVKRLWGRGPGLLATLLGGIATWYFIIEPRFSFAIVSRTDALNLVCYFAVGAGISFLGEASGRLPASPGFGVRRIRLRVIRQTAVLAGAAVVLVGMLLLLLHDFERDQYAQGWVAHTYQVMNSTESVLSLMNDAETGERGYLLTGDKSYLRPYNSAIAALPRGLKVLNDLTSDNPRQQARWNELNRLTGMRLTLLRHGIELRTASGADAALAVVRSGQGEQVMEKLRSILDEVMSEERQLLVGRTAKAREQASRELWVLGLGSTALILLLVLASVVIERETVRREQITQVLARHTDLLEQAHDSLITWPLGGAISYWSRGAETLYGYTREEALGRSSHELLHSDHPLGMAQVDALLERDGQWNGELTQTTKDGRKLIVEGQWTLAVDADGTKTVLEANRDITARKQAEQALRESETQFRTLANAIPPLCWMANADGWIFWYNERWYQYTGTTPEQMEGWGWQSVHDPEMLPQVLERWKESIATGKPFYMIFPLRGADGVFRPFLTRVMPLCDQDAKVVRWFGTNTDISEQRRNEEALRASEARLRILGDNLPEGAIFRFCQDAQGQQCVDFISAGIERLTGVPAAEIMRDWGAVLEGVPPEDREQMQAAIAVSHQRLTPFEIEVRHRHRVTGELHWSLLRSLPTRYPDGSTVWDGVELDITHMKQAEESLRASEGRERARAAEFEALMEAAPVGIFRSDDIECRWMTGNRQAHDLLRRPRSSNLSKSGPEDEKPVNFRAMKEGKEIPLSELPMQKAAATGQSVREFEMEFVFMDGVTRNILGDAVPLLDESGHSRGAIGAFVDITGLKRAERDLRESEQRFRALMTASSGAIYRMSPDWSEMRQLRGGNFIHDTEKPNRNWLPEYIHPEDQPQVMAVIQEAIRTKSVFELEHRVLRVDGTLGWTFSRAVPMLDANGEIIEWFGAASDITARKQAEAQNLLLATAIEQAAETVVITDRDATIQYVNPAFCHTTGYTRGEAIGQNPRILKSGQHEAQFYQRLWATVTAGKLWHGEFTNRRKDGTVYMEEATIAPVRNAAGQITNYIAIKYDITERKQAENALRESEMMLRFFVQHAPAAIAMLDREMRYIVVSNRWMTDYQLGDRDIQGLTHYEVFPEVPERWKEIHQRCLAGGVENCEEDPFRRPDGRIDWVRWQVRPWRRIDDTIGGIIIFSELITARKQAEDALAESEIHYRQLFEQSESALGIYEMVLDAQGNPCDYRYLNVNPAWERVTGMKSSEILGRTALEITPGIEEYWIKLFGRVAATGEPATFENYVRHLGRYFSGTAYSPRSNQVVVSFTDSTERIHAEEAVRQLNVELEERVRSRTAALEAANRELEAFAHSVSHDLRSPLRGIDGWSLALLEDYGERLDAQGHKYLDRVRSEAQRMGRLIDDLLQLSRVGRAELVPRPVDLTSLAKTIVARLKEANPDRAIEFKLAPHMKCTGDARLLEIALTNLLDNAAKFTGPRTPARVEFGQTEFEGKPAFFVRDNGVGFDMAYAKMLFAPFQRLHKASEFPGTGIGLATVQRVIHRHGGRIWAEARLGEGATFCFTLGVEK
jgi:PAS domain S-box-containing protein